MRFTVGALLFRIGVCSAVSAVSLAGCSDHASNQHPHSQTFDLEKIVYAEGFTLGTIPKNTKVDVYPTYIVIRRPAPDATTIVPMDKVLALDVEAR